MASLEQIAAYLRVRSGPLPTPNYLELSLSGICNFACVQCHQLHHLREDRLIHSRRGASILDGGTAARVIEEAALMGIETIEICGRGEPTLHRDLPGLIRFLKANSIKGRLVTNGSRVSDELLEALHESLFDEVTVSLYGFDEASFNLRARPRSPVELHTIIEQAIAIKCKAPATLVTMTVPVEIDMEWDTAESLIAALDGITVDNLEFVAIRPYTSGTMVAHVKSSVKTHEVMISRLEKVESAVALNLARFIRNHRDISVDTIASTYKTIPCYAGYWAIFVADDATVRPCSNSNLVLGDLKKNTLSEIWNGTKYENFRNLALRHIIDTAQPIQDSYCSHCGWARFQEQLHHFIISEKNVADIAIH
jgi:GTP 3',8-cyclase